ncbi:GNAT family N-acetyltransferase [Sphaerisporangium sp. NPDC088356]|uniref:GNAT family N-acetyltransferase n=1 Tax=Sphaerisporangium sp. NPDC088356 TaxID=3154871 RepID=UPI00344421D5
MFLKTERLALRPFTEADVDDLFDLHDDPEVMRFINGGRPASREEILTEDLPRFLHYYERLDRAGWEWRERAARPYPEG